MWCNDGRRKKLSILRRYRKELNNFRSIRKKQKAPWEWTTEFGIMCTHSVGLAIDHDCDERLFLRLKLEGDRWYRDGMAALSKGNP